MGREKFWDPPKLGGEKGPGEAGGRFVELPPYQVIKPRLPAGKG
jgi:hypothetical protein